jgi:hypothetical protein
MSTNSGSVAPLDDELPALPNFGRPLHHGSDLAGVHPFI